MPLLRRTPLPRRKTWLPRRRKEPRRSGRVRNKAYLAWVHTLPCYARETGQSGGWECCGKVTADHVGRRPYGRKSDDRDAIPLCEFHHTLRQRYRGPWKGFNGERMRDWCDVAILVTRSKWEAV